MTFANLHLTSPEYSTRPFIPLRQFSVINQVTATVEFTTEDLIEYHCNKKDNAKDEDEDIEQKNRRMSEKIDN